MAGKNEKLHGFDECIIIPIKLYDKLNNSKNNLGKITKLRTKMDKARNGGKLEKILLDENIGTPDLKMKMYNQTKKLNTRTRNRGVSKTESKEDNKGVKRRNAQVEKGKDEMDLSSTLPVHTQSIGKRIINAYIKENRDKIDWDGDTLELILDGEPQTGTNIVKLLRYVLDDDENRYRFAPYKIKEFRDALKEVGVPDGWLNTTNERKGEREKESRFYTRFSPSMTSTIRKRKIGEGSMENEEYFTLTEGDSGENSEQEEDSGEITFKGQNYGADYRWPGIGVTGETGGKRLEEESLNKGISEERPENIIKSVDLKGETSRARPRTRSVSRSAKKKERKGKTKEPNLNQWEGFE